MFCISWHETCVLSIHEARSLQHPNEGEAMRERILALCVAASVGAFAIVAAEKAQAANISASENGDIAVLSGSEFDVSSFSATSSGESADGSGVFLANATATGMALIVLTEGVGGPNSDWLELVYSGSGRSESITAHWRSDSDPGGLPALPTGVTPEFLIETGASVDVTALLVASATASGFAFPSNITIQVQSDAPEPVPERASLVLLGTAQAGFGLIRRRRRSV